jgi:glyoxylase-like metal-dependent hydrolase (beta-lactamase superfamily II)
MKIHIIESGMFKLDGGAMFGVVPKSMWNKLNPSDQNNMCSWAMRCLLIDTGKHVILVDTGIGHKQDDKFRSHFEPHGPYDLFTSIENAGYKPEDITDVFLTHLHFDHVGGAVKLDSAGKLVPTFPNATYWSNRKHWNWALNPNPREKASFLKENFLPLEEAGVVEFIDLNEAGETEWLEGIQIITVHGHTEAMMLLKVPYKNTYLYYCADLIPSSYHIGIPYVMSYDVRPLLTLTEKEKLLNEVLNNKGYLFFEHDPTVACTTITRHDSGRIVRDQVITNL